MKVNLAEVIEAIENTGMEIEYYYDTGNQEILMVFDGMVNGENDPELIEEIREGFIEEYIPLPRQYEINEYHIMECFIWELPAGRKQDVLERAIKGRGAFLRFKDRLYDLGLEQEWYNYRDNAYERIARDWCERFGLDIIEDAES